jgi:hypothetical protein
MPTPTTPNTNVLKPYQPANYPQTDAGRFVQNELNKIANSIGLIIQVLKEHETRLASGSL